MPYKIVLKTTCLCRFQTCVSLHEGLRMGDWCVINTERGDTLGRIVKFPVPVDNPPNPKDACKFIRLALPEDIKQNQKNRELEQQAFDFCVAKARERNLTMKLVRVEYLFDRSKATFYFTADGRIDFRELVRDLAYEFRTRIEMKQIGVRDEAKLMGGLGICGREVCCSSFLDDFEPVSIRMAKIQNLTLDPTKISGVCGRLMCCLEYEHPTYDEMRKKLPRPGENVKIQGEEGRVKSVDVLEESILVEFEDGRVIKVLAKDIEPRNGKGKE